MRDDSQLTKEQLRFERFAAIRAKYPEMDFDWVMEWVGDYETNEAEAAEGIRILTETDR